MKNLKEKTFWTLFIILTIFLIIIVIVFNYQNYRKEYLGIETNLNRVRMFSRSDNFDKPLEIKENPIIMDYNIYTILLNKNNEAIEVINHSDEWDIDINEIVSYILSKEKKENIIIKNLYFSKYSYNYKPGEYLILLDNTMINKSLLNNFAYSFILLLIFEVVIFYLSKLIANWITKPAIESYEKQKEFIANASHELKTPLAVIMASADALAEKNDNKWLNNIKYESDRMNNLITSLLDLSKLEQPNKEAYVQTDLSKLVEKSILTLESLAYENDLSFKIAIEKDIYFHCNNLEISELISILVDNAIKHGKKKSKIKVNLFKEKNEIILEVINKGEELSKEDCERIFERFYRVDKSRNRDSNRYGLGLAIAKSIVENHDGDIIALSEKGYTTFKVTFKQA